MSFEVPKYRLLALLKAEKKLGLLVMELTTGIGIKMQ